MVGPDTEEGTGVSAGVFVPAAAPADGVVSRKYNIEITMRFI